MSYDLVVFDPTQAPTESVAFLKWYEQQAEDSDDSSELASAELRSFFAALSTEFPAMNGPHSTQDVDNPKLTDYSFGPYSVHMSFAWSQTAEAGHAVAKLAKRISVGLYDISDPAGFIWWPSRPGRSNDHERT